MRRPFQRVILPAVLLMAAPAGIAVAEPVDELPPGDFANVELHATLPEAAQATSINFLSYGNGARARDIMVVNGRFGLQTWDLADPADPVLLDHLTSEELKLPSDTSGTFWQNEDMDVDQDRKVVFMARDPRAYNGSTSNPDSIAGVYVVDAADPEDLQLKTFHELPTGHTSTCVNDCDFLWTGGPASNTEQAAEWPGGRPVFVTDLRDLDDISTYETPIDTGRNDGVTDYAHDVQVDAAGIAWVSGRGGVRGYHTTGRHLDPLTGVRRVATAWDPIPFGGGGFPEDEVPSQFMHNSFRPVASTLRDGGNPSPDHRPGSLLMATEEAFGSSTCDGIGMFSIASLEGSYDGQGWMSTPDDPFRLEVVGTWSPAGEEGTTPNAFCSAHYFEVQDNIVAYSWYAQGTRFLDVSDPTDPIQVAYFRPDDSVSWAPYFHGDYIYVADNSRGVDVLSLTDGADANAAAHRQVNAPAMSATQIARVEALVADYAPDPDFGWACVIPRT
ncbi:LVIVD repeat-containing protein [Salsipaludibacter albus]|uniref:LVIVD repeat-containing protein n=1 Tax=Salsipaludibacter albus TaxID=2849650 RepID=UPI001EE4A061|nr:hypothetical protein [Salsipaludibacter albus]MBY5161822.1 hypothetical protein [Salsipaludibacter albus]